MLSTLRHQGIRQIISLILVGLVTLVGAHPTIARIRTGVHCPTAEVQMIKVVEKTCCGKEVVTFRKPIAGENGFKQCECSVKKATKQNEVTSSPVIPIFFCPTVNFTFSLPRADVPDADIFDEQIIGLALAPPTPPPPSVS